MANRRLNSSKIRKKRISEKFSVSKTENFAIFRKLRGQKISKFRYLGQFFYIEKYGYENFPIFELFVFLGIKYEISHSGSKSTLKENDNILEIFFQPLFRWSLIYC